MERLLIHISILFYHLFDLALENETCCVVDVQIAGIPEVLWALEQADEELFYGSKDLFCHRVLEALTLFPLVFEHIEQILL